MEIKSMGWCRATMALIAPYSIGKTLVNLSWLIAGCKYFLLIGFELFLATNYSWAQTSERVKHGVAVKNITSDIALATCFKWLPVADIPANQVYIQTQSGGVLSGIPWDIQQAKRLQKDIRKAGGKHIKYLVINELNDDRVTVIEYFQRKGAVLITDSTTARRLAQDYQIKAEITIHSDTLVTIGKRQMVFFPLGRGFTDGGLSVYLPDCHVLHAGYFIISPTARYPAIHPKTSMSDWATNLEKLYFRFSNAKKVIPGQGQPGNANLIKHSIALVNKIDKSNKYIQYISNQDPDADDDY